MNIGDRPDENNPNQQNTPPNNSPPDSPSPNDPSPDPPPPDAHATLHTQGLPGSAPDIGAPALGQVHKLTASPLDLGQKGGQHPAFSPERKLELREFVRQFLREWLRTNSKLPTIKSGTAEDFLRSKLSDAELALGTPTLLEHIIRPVYKEIRDEMLTRQ
jgi:hypothetical protein